MSGRPSWERIAFIYAALFGLVALAYFFADRQLAAEVHAHLAGVEFFPWLTHIVDPLGPLASIGAAIVAVRALARGSLTPLESALLRLSCAILIAWALKEELKWTFGRTWPETWIRGNPNPSYFGNGVYGFFPFHGGQGYASFPSGHTTAIAAFAAAVWVLWPKLRWVAVTMALAVAIGLLGADYHWLSDIIAGAILGSTTGVAAAQVGRGTAESEPTSERQPL